MELSKTPAVVWAIFLFVHGIPGFIDDSGWWFKILGGAGWHWWNYVLVAAGSLGLLYSTLPLFQKAWDPRIANILRERLSWEKEKINPDCTFNDLWSNYLQAQIFTDSPGFEIRVEMTIGFQVLNEFLSRKLFEGKIKAWGKEIRNGRASHKETLISREYWEFNRIDFGEKIIDTNSMEELVYTSLRFNQEQMIEEMELFFSNYDEEMQNAQDTDS